MKKFVTSEDARSEREQRLYPYTVVETDTHYVVLHRGTVAGVAYAKSEDREENEDIREKVCRWALGANMKYAQRNFPKDIADLQVRMRERHARRLKIAETIEE